MSNDLKGMVANSLESENLEDLKIVQICHGPVIPEYVSAYSLRCHNLFHELSKEIVSVGGAVLRDAGRSQVHQFRSILLTGFSAIMGNRSFEVFLSKGRFLRSKYRKTATELIKKSDIVVFEGPWQYRIFKKYLKDKFIVYDAHNCETQLRAGNKYQAYVRNLETELVSECDLIFSVTSRDLQSLKLMDNGAISKFHLIPHILPPQTVTWDGKESREITFIGSMYGPNVDAMSFILDLSKDLPDFTFNIIGSVCSAPRKGSYPNVKFLGVISENEKNEILLKSMFAINPVKEGSGRNVKMVDYLLHKVPVISTKIGVKGFEGYPADESILIAELSDFKKLIRQYDMNRGELSELSIRSGEIYDLMSKNEMAATPEEILMQVFRHS